MAFATFYCLSIILLFIIFFIYTSTHIFRIKPKFIHKLQVEMVKNHLEQTYKLKTYQDSFHS